MMDRGVKKLPKSFCGPFDVLYYLKYNLPKCFVFNHADFVTTQTREIQPFEISKKEQN